MIRNGTRKCVPRTLRRFSLYMIKAVFFDAVGTLIYLPRSVGEHYREVALRFGADFEAAKLNDAFRTAWAHSPVKPSQRGPRPHDDKEWWRSLVDRVLEQVLPTGQSDVFDAVGYFEALYVHFAEPGVWKTYPEVVDVLTTLRQRSIAMAVISNFDRRLYAVFDDLELSPFFKHIIISSEIGSDKPDPFIFQRALEMMNVSPPEAIHVGDDPKRDWGAEAVGLRVFRLDRSTMDLNDLIKLIGDHNT